MAIQYNENIRIAAPAPLDRRYYSTRKVSGVQVPYSATTEVNTVLTTSERFSGLTVNVNGVEYWYKNGILNTDLIEKKYDTVIPSGNFVTGGTNIGFFSGRTGIQTLSITVTNDSSFNGNYLSVYNDYYFGSDGKIHVGLSPIDGIGRRGYVKTTGSIKSLIWSDYESGLYFRGWILLNGDLSQLIGVSALPNLYRYYNGFATTPYVNNTWTSGIGYNNGSEMVVSTVLGSTTTGDTITIGGPIYSHVDNNLMYLRTLNTKTPNLVGVSYDEGFVYVSGRSSSGTNLGTGIPILTGVTNNDFKYRTLRGSGNTTIALSSNNREILIHSTAGTNYVEGYGIDIVGNTISVEPNLFLERATFNSVLPILDRAITGATNGLVKYPNSPTGRVVGLGGSLTNHTEITSGLFDFTLNTRNITLQSINAINIIDTNGVGGINLESDGGTISIVGNTNLSVPSTKIDVAFNQLRITDNRTDVNQKGIEYAGNYHTNYTNRSLVDKEYVDNIIIGSNVYIATTNYTVVNSDEYIGVSGASIITLMSVPEIGEKIIVADILGNANTTPIIINGNGNLINGNSTVNINTNYGSITMIYNGFNWSIIAFVN